MAYTLVDEVPALSTPLDSLSGFETSPPSLFVDLERNNLSPRRTISILEYYVHPQNHVYLIDVHKKGADAFKIGGSNAYTVEITLKSVLELSAIPKAFFDIRNDSDALHSLYQIALANVDDLQLMEFATRAFAMMAFSEKQQWITIKKYGHLLFDAKAGGSDAVFDERPLSKTVQSYCIQDVLHLPGLWNLYSQKVSNQKLVSVRYASQARLEESRSLHFHGKGQDMALGPWPGWSTTPNPKEGTRRSSHGATKHADLSKVDHRPRLRNPNSPPDRPAAHNYKSQHQRDPNEWSGEV